MPSLFDDHSVVMTKMRLWRHQDSSGLSSSTFHKCAEHDCAGNDYVNHDYASRRYAGHSYVGHNYVGHSYVGHVGPCRTARTRRRSRRRPKVVIALRYLWPLGIYGAPLGFVGGVVELPLHRDAARLRLDELCPGGSKHVGAFAPRLLPSSAKKVRQDDLRAV